VLGNVLCLCPNHHVLFDSGAVSVMDDLRLIGMEGKLQAVLGHALSQEFLRYHKEQIYRLPAPIAQQEERLRLVVRLTVQREDGLLPSRYGNLCEEPGGRSHGRVKHSHFGNHLSPLARVGSVGGQFYY
jgi:hypothetical protein